MFTTLYEKLSAIFSVIIGFLIGGWNTSLTILICFMILDFITGIIKAIKTATLDSTKCRWGIFTKFLMFIPLILSNLISVFLNLDGAILNICIIFYICSEGLSITENLIQIGIPLPEQLIDILVKVQKENNNEITDKKEN